MATIATIVKVKAEPTGHIILNHKRCGTVTRTFVGPHFFKGYAADGVTPVETYSHLTECGGCGMNLKTHMGEMIYGKLVDEIACSSKCTGATGHNCSCSCGGRNHGGKWGA